jgi:type I restriction enzyme R subunit
MALIQDVQADEWWQDVTVPMLERMRRRLRGLVQFIEKRQRRPIYTDFEDQLGEEQEVVLPGFSVGTNAAKFRAKAQAFLRGHLDHVAIAKLHRNKPLTAQDLEELERMLAESGVGAPDEIKQAAEAGRGLGLFVRSLIGLDREAAKEAMAGFIGGRTLSANQLEFINLVVDHLTAHGAMPAERLYESPFTDLSPQGPEALFSTKDVDALVQVLGSVEARTRVA